MPVGMSDATSNWPAAIAPTSGSIRSIPLSFTRSATLRGESAPSATELPAITTVRSRTSSPLPTSVTVTSTGLKTPTGSSATVWANVRATGSTASAALPLTVTAAWPGRRVV